MKSWSKQQNLKRIEQREKIIKEFVQKFKRAVRDSSYKRKILVKEFKRKMNKVIRRKLIEIKRFSTNIK